MKTSLALTALSTKLIILLCVSCMGFMGMVQESMAEQPSPCHQEMVQEKEAAKTACQMCETALEAWEEDAVATSDVQIAEVTESIFSVDSITENFALELKPLEGIYQAYYPPPQVLLKAVTPSTKTIVLLF